MELNLFGRGILGAAMLRGTQLDRASRNPQSVQERALFKLLKTAQDTSFGRAHRFAEIKTVKEFRERVPIHGYRELKPWFERSLVGEGNVTWPGKVKYFGMSSGTTAGNKYLPISMASVRQQQRGGFDPLASYLRLTKDPSVLGGKYLMLGGSSELERHESGAWIGDNTGVMANHMPRLVRGKYLPKKSTRAIADWDTKIRQVAQEAVRTDVRLVAGTPSWFPGLFDEVMRAGKVEGGSIFDVWPNLKLITGGGIGYEAYRPLIEERLGAQFPYIDVYNATEGGIMGVQDRLDDPAMRLLPDNGLFYEFIPVDELDSDNPTRHSLWEVETQCVYAIAVSTMSGIWSYTIGDCLRFTETYPHRFVFEGRTAAFLNVAGEHVSQGELERAVRVASQRVGVRVAEFTVSADVGVNGTTEARHVYLLELDEPGTPGGEALANAARLIDQDIRALNGDYEAHRAAHGLQEPLVRSVPKGTFHEFMRVRGKLGGQNKIPRVVMGENRDLLESCARPLQGQPAPRVQA